MSEEELEFCTLCGPLADAVEMLDEGNIEGAKAVMLRVIRRAQEICSRETRQNGAGPTSEETAGIVRHE